MQLKLGIVLTLLIAVVIFTLQNTELVTIQFLLWNFSLSRALMIFLVFAVGIVIGALLGSHHQKRKPEAEKNKPAPRSE